MTCGHAEENCPFLPGAELRVPITYEDPKVSDGTPKAEEVYDERCAQIAREMLFLAQKAV
jgi:arsenate reductase